MNLDDKSIARAFDAARVQHLRADLALTPEERLIRVAEMVREMDARYGKPPAPGFLQFDSYDAFYDYKARRKLMANG